MKSPFPGMDPYLERRWGDVHTALCAEIRTALQPNLPRGLRARATEDVLLEDAVEEFEGKRGVEIIDTAEENKLITAIEIVGLGNRTSVNRAVDPDLWHIFPMKLRDPLPTIPIPCRKTDGDVELSLQPLIDRIYLKGGHDDMDYSKSIHPPFSPKTAEWALQLIAEARPGK